MTTEPIDAGEFGEWLRGFVAALDGDLDTDVPCGTCTGCCTSSWYIPLRPVDAAVVPLVPATRLLDVPGQPGRRVIGYDARGHCPLLHDGRCTAYAVRPRTCRTFDCRVFAAAGLRAGGSDKAAINERVARWRFRYADAPAERAHAAVRAAATFLRNDAASFPVGQAPDRPGEVAVAAVRAHALFLDEPVPTGREAKRALARRVLAVLAAPPRA